MRTLPVSLLIAGFTLVSTFTKAAVLADFEDLTLAPESFENGSGLVLAGSFASQGMTLNNDYDAGFSFWSGFAYSNTTDNTTPGFGNQYSAFTGGGSTAGGEVSTGSNYALAYVDLFGFGIVPTILLPVGESPVSIRITNTTYTALSLPVDDMFSDPFGGVSGDDPDYLLLTINGFDAGNTPTGSVDFYLADYRFSNNALDYIVNSWELVDLSSLGANTRSLQFEMESTDTGKPSYFALDNVQTVPEPGSVLLLGVASAGFLVRRRRH